MPDSNTASQQKGSVDSTTTTSIRLPSKLWAEVRKAAIDRGTSAQQFTTDALALALKSNRSKTT